MGRIASIAVGKTSLVLGGVAILISLCLAVAAGIAVVDIVFFSPEADQMAMEREVSAIFSRTAERINPASPIVFDASIRLDRIVAGPGARLSYHFSFPEYSSGDIHGSRLLARLKSGVMAGICASYDMRLALQHGGIYVFSYSGNDGINVGGFAVSSPDCLRLASAHPIVFP